MKILNVVDPHIRVEMPQVESRTDDYDKTIANKMNQIAKIARKHEVDIISFTGDVFDKKYPSTYSFKAITGNMRVIQKLKEDSGVKEIISIAGNHDLPFSAYENVNKSYYGMVSNQLGIFSDISYNTIQLGETATVSGIPFQSDPNKMFSYLEELNKRLNPDDNNMVILHEHFLPFSKEPGDLQYTHFFRYEDLLKYDNIHVFALGHLHRGFPPAMNELPNGRMQHYCNSWSLYRLARNYYVMNDEHIPAVDIINLGEEINITSVPLSVEPMSTVFKPKILEREISMHKELDNFVESLKSGVNTIDINESMNVPLQIKDTIQRYMDIVSTKSN